MTTLRQFSPQVEVYSIDEMFLLVDDTPEELKAFSLEIKNTLWRDVRIPVSVGVAPTKTLAKLANQAAKKIPQCLGVCVLDESDKWEWLLQRLPVTAVWGIARRTGRRLNRLNINTAYELSRSDPKFLRKQFNVCLERIIEELNGHSCMTLEDTPKDKKQIFCTRSFGKKAKSLQPIKEAIALYSARAAEKLRQQNHLVKSIYIFLHTSPFEDNYYSDSATTLLPFPTDDTRLISRCATATVTHLYKDGYAFLKAGIGLIDLIDRQYNQPDFLQPGQSERSRKLMQTIDQINRTYKKGTVFFASQSMNKPWYMRQQYRSPAYTTRWSELPVALA